MQMSEEPKTNLRTEDGSEVRGIGAEKLLWDVSDRRIKKRSMMRKNNHRPMVQLLVELSGKPVHIGPVPLSKEARISWFRHAPGTDTDSLVIVHLAADDVGHAPVNVRPESHAEKSDVLQIYRVALKVMYVAKSLTDGEHAFLYTFDSSPVVVLVVSRNQDNPFVQVGMDRNELAVGFLEGIANVSAECQHVRIDRCENGDSFDPVRAPTLKMKIRENFNSHKHQNRVSTCGLRPTCPIVERLAESGSQHLSKLAKTIDRPEVVHATPISSSGATRMSFGDCSSHS